MFAPLLAAPDPATQPVAEDGRRAGDVLPAGQLGVAARFRHACRSLAPSRPADGWAPAVGDCSERAGRLDLHAMLAALLLVGGLGGAAFHPPAAALVHAVSGERKGLAMSTHISGGSLGFALAPLVFAPAVLWLGRSWAWLVADPGLIALSYTLRLMRRVEIPRKHAKEGWGHLRPYAKPLGAALHHRRAAHADREQPVGFPARAADADRAWASSEASAAVSAVSVRQHGRRVSRRAAGGSLRRAPRHHLVAGRPPSRFCCSVNRCRAGG